MKKLIFSLLILSGVWFSNHMAAQSHFSTKIGELVNGNAVLTYDIATLKTELASFLSSHSSVNVTFSSATIEFDGNRYLLVGSNADNSINTAVGLVLDGNSFYQEVSAIGGSSSCTCEGCREGCNPKKDAGGDWYCTECGFEHGTCRKTVTASGFGIFGSDKN